MHFLFLDVQTLSVKERHFILPLVRETLLCSLSLLFLHHHKIVQSLFSLTIKVHTYLGAIFIAFAPMTTYLKDLIQSIGRYSGLSWHETGFKGFWMHK